MNPEGSELYLDLMERVLANVIYEDVPIGWYGDLDGYDRDTRSEGRDLPTVAHTMVGLKRLKNVRSCVTRVLREGVPGDLIETGVWRGGVCILMRAVLEAYGERDRRVWVADSFEGVPETRPESHPLDQEMALHRINQVLSVSRAEVAGNFSRYGLLDDQVRFLEGWFRHTLPDAPTGPLAVLRLDGDLYESTTDALTHLYPRLSPGGFVIIDDYNIEPCRQAVEDYRGRRRITEPVRAIDGHGVYWRRASPE
ncbi:TylF/MycF family methyltransferase [Streptomyces sp. NPDC003077]|uniref:TylF/MycF family methyltransferase n=1 Tax=Streptomyces sp. NPDC003077 TaxID=3154443 RepID=UPI0033A015B9